MFDLESQDEIMIISILFLAILYSLFLISYGWYLRNNPHLKNKNKFVDKNPRIREIKENK